MNFSYFRPIIGIYKITNKITFNTYIGNSKCFQKRIYEHFQALLKGNHTSKDFQEEFLKYGYEAFEVELIEECEESELREKEDFYLKDDNYCHRLLNTTKKVHR